MRCRCRPVRMRLTAVILGLLFLASGAARPSMTPPPVSYKIESIVKSGDRVGNITLRADSVFVVDALDDPGQITLEAQNAAGGDVLLQSTNGAFTPIVAVGQDAPGGKWPVGVTIGTPTSTNKVGNVVFSYAVPNFSENKFVFQGTYLWDPQAQKSTALVLPGTAAIQNTTFTEAGGPGPALNNQGEVVFPALIDGPAGPTGHALFFLGRDGKLQPLLLPGEALPGGGHARTDLNTDTNFEPSLNDSGVVAFLVRREGDTAFSAYASQQGVLTPVVLVGMDAPGGGKINGVSRVFVNNANQNILVAAGVDNSARQGLYLFGGGKLTPVAVSGQSMPGGGMFASLQDFNLTKTGIIPPTLGVSRPNELGQCAFVAILADGSTAAYRMDADGQLSLILQKGMTTSVGTIALIGKGSSSPVGEGIGFNSSGQVVLPVKTIEEKGKIVRVLLLTPATP